MKRLLTILIASLSITAARAQLEPIYTQYMFNELLINPAYTGITDNLVFNAQSRFQWVGFEGAPRTHAVSGHTVLKDKLNGVGGTIVHDRLGETQSTMFTGSFAHHLPITADLTLSMGLSGGFSQYRTDLTEVDIPEEDPAFSEDLNKILPVFGFGLFAYSDHYYVGVSVPHFANNPFRVKNTVSGNLSPSSRHYLISAGYMARISENVNVKPNLLIKFVEGAAWQLDLNANFQFFDKYWAGFSWRSLESVDILLEYQFAHNMKLGYSYDFVTSGLRDVARAGSHEIMINFELKDKEVFSGGKDYHPRISF